MGFQLYTANYLEVLAKLYAKISFNRTDDPFEPQCVVVQTQGMASYLKQFLAMECGIAFNMQMPFPKNFCENLICRNFPEFKNSQQHFAPEAMSRAIYRIFEEAPDKFPELDFYFSGSEKELRKWQLAEEIAALFDNYQIYRYKQADFLSGDHWQGRLWKMLEARNGGCRGKNCFFNKFLNAPALRNLPPKITVFGVGSLPPLYVDIFFKLSEFTDVEFFYLNPCCCYWADLYKKYRNGEISADEELNVGNQLLASWGESGRQLFSSLLTHADKLNADAGKRAELVEDRGEVTVRFSEEKIFFPFTADENPTLLARIQQDILEMRPCPLYNGADDDKSPYQDGSLEILNCHSPGREIEILHDKLLKAIVCDGVKPRDVVVMAPDINKFIPLIDAVFSKGALQNCYTVSDRNLQTSGSFASAFEKLLDMENSRMTVSEIISLLAIPAVGNAYEIGKNELAVIRKWINKAGIRWGIDGESREEHCGVKFDEFSWRPALDRMMSLFACGDDTEQELIGGVEIPDEEELPLFGRFSEFICALDDLQKNLKKRRTTAEWITYFQSCIEKFFLISGDTEQEELTMIRSVFANCVKLAEMENFQSEIPFSVIRHIIERALTVPGGHFSFLRGKITFCSLTPLRSIPAQIIAVIGLNSGEFPRRDITPGFNLMTAKMMCGDRSSAREDRYLFLEALMSARRNFWLFYDGRVRRTGKASQPSTVLVELMDYLQRGYGVREVKHFLQPFDPAYFRGDEFQSFSGENFAIARLLNGSDDGNRNTKSSDSFQSAYDANPAPEGKIHIQLSDLIEWAANPSKYFLSGRLNVRLEEPEVFEDEEMISPNALEKWKVCTTMLEMDRHHYPETKSRNALQKANMLPPGALGEQIWREYSAEIGGIKGEWKQQYFMQEHLAMQFEMENTVVSGMFDCSPDLLEQRLFTLSRLKHKHYVNALIRHCALTMISYGGSVRTSLSGFEKGQWRELAVWQDYARSERCCAFMKLLIMEFRRWQDAPAPFFPCVLTALANKEEWSDAEKCFFAWNGKYGKYGDLDDPFIARCFTVKEIEDKDVRFEIMVFKQIFYDIVKPLDRFAGETR